MKMTRDSWVWLVLLVSAILTFLLGQFEMVQQAFGIGPEWESRIQLIAGIVAVIAAKMGVSPLGLSQEGKDKVRRTGSLMLLIGALAFSSAACASMGVKGKTLVSVDDMLHDSLERVKQSTDRLCSAKAPVLSVEICKTVYTNLVPALQAGASYNRAVRLQRFSEMSDLVTAIGNLTTALKSVPAQYRGAMETDVRSALLAVSKS